MNEWKDAKASESAYQAKLAWQSATTRSSTLLKTCTGVVRSFLTSANFCISVLICAWEGEWGTYS